MSGLDLTGAEHGGKGHNQPPSDIEIVEQKAREENPELFNHADKLIAAVDKLPQEIKTEEDAGKVGDFMKTLADYKKKVNGLRVAEKEPHITKGRAIDGFFKGFNEKIDDVLKVAAPIQAVWVRKKEEEERIKKEEAAEEKRLESEKVAREAEEKARIAEEKRVQAEKEKLEAEEKAQRERDELALKVEADRKAKQDEIDRLQKEKDDEAAAAQKIIDDLKAKGEADKKAIAEAEAEKKRLEREKQKAVRDAKKEKERLEVDKRAEERRIKREEKAAEEAALKSEREAKKTDREANRDLDKSIKLENQAGKLDKSIDKASHAASRVRGVGGSVSTVRREWIGVLVNREELDLEALRQHIPEDALQKAVSSFVRAGGRTLKGANIYEDDKVTVR